MGLLRQALSPSLAHLAHGGNNVRVGAAAADVARHGVLDVFVAGADWLLEQGDGAHDLATGAVAALVAVMLNKSSLHGMQIAGLTEAFDGGDLVTLVHQSKGETAVDAPSIHMHGTRAALAMIAALFCAGKVDPLAQCVEQGRTRIEASQFVFFAVDAKSQHSCACALNRFLRVGRNRRGSLHQWRSTSQQSGSAEPGEK